MAFENALLRRRVAVDTLTGVYRRHYLWKRIQAEWCRSLRHHRPLSIAMIDIDGFKKINDRRGHIFGDQVLRATARTLQRGIRREDLLGRYGGDEFLLSLPETDSAGAQIIVERLRTSVQSRGDSTVSIGVCSYPNEKTGDVRGLLELADVALLRAKSEGKNRVCVYERV
jgi:diguanylate cyclase (GGDEF)-like protein